MRGMLSRAAENIYWMGRYVERSAEICRMLSVGEQLTVELRGLSPSQACRFWRQLENIYPGSIAPVVPEDEPASSFAEARAICDARASNRRRSA